MPRQHIPPKTKKYKSQLAGPGNFWRKNGGFVAIGGLLTLGLGMLCSPTLGQGAQAVTCTSDSDPNSPECQIVAGVNTNVSTVVRSTIGVAIGASMKMDVVPKSQGTFAKNSVDLSVTTNNTTGYAVYLQTPDNSSELKAANPQITESIGAVDGMMTEADYADNLNKWGYAINDAASYKAIPKSGDEAVLRTEGASRKDDYKLNVAVAVGTDLPAGVYSNELLVSVIANPIEVRSLSDITTMQEMTTEICNISLENETKQLIDTRDGKSYWVAKLKDGNCWMTQNLALDITEDGLKATDTDIATDWNQSSEYPPVDTYYGFVQSEAGGVTSRFSWDYGLRVVQHPTGDAVCGNAIQPGTCAGFVDVSGSDWQPTYEAKEVDGVFTAINEETKEYDAHYLTGNYYAWNAAVAGGGGKTAQTDIEGSICPKGWTLPGGQGEAASGISHDNDYYRLFNAYGLHSNPVNDDYNIMKAPLYFVRGGDYQFGQTRFWALGTGGYYQTKRSNKATSNYYMQFSSSIVHPSWDSAGNSDHGYSVRCMNNPNI